MAERTGSGGYGPQYETERGYTRPRWDYDRETMRRESERDDWYERGEWGRVDQESGYWQRPRQWEREEYPEPERRRRREGGYTAPGGYADPRFAGTAYEADWRRRDELSRRFGTYDWDRGARPQARGARVRPGGRP